MAVVLPERPVKDRENIVFQESFNWALLKPVLSWLLHPSGLKAGDVTLLFNYILDNLITAL